MNFFNTWQFRKLYKTAQKRGARISLKLFYPEGGGECFHEIKITTSPDGHIFNNELFYMSDSSLTSLLFYSIQAMKETYYDG